MRYIIFSTPTNPCCIWIPVINTKGEEPGFTEAQAEARAWTTLPPDAINPRFIQSSDLTLDRDFRDAWKSDLTVDMQKARQIHRQRLREKRQPLFDYLDAEYLRADENNNTARKQLIAARKQALRNVPQDPAIDAAATPETLKTIIPVALTDPLP